MVTWGSPTKKNTREAAQRAHHAHLRKGNGIGSAVETLRLEAFLHGPFLWRWVGKQKSGCLGGNHDHGKSWLEIMGYQVP